MNEPVSINLVDWLVYADYCFDNNLNEQRARNIAKAIKYNKIYLYLCYKFSKEVLISGIHHECQINCSISPNFTYFWEINKPNTNQINMENISPICPVEEKYNQCMKDIFIQKYFNKLQEIGEKIEN